MSQSFRAHLIKELPKDKAAAGGSYRALAHTGKALIKDLSQISFEMAQMVVARQDGEGLPDWFMVEVVRDLPRLVEKKRAQ